MMSKRTLMAFSFGIFFTVSIIGTYYYAFSDENETISQKEAKDLLKEKNYVILTKSKYNQLVEGKSDATKNQGKKETGKKETIKEEKSTPEKEVVPQKESVVKKNEDVISYQLQITSGMTSEGIAEVLERQGIIKDHSELSAFLDNNGYSTKIQLGEFTVTSEMGFEQIARIITKS